MWKLPSTLVCMLLAGCGGAAPAGPGAGERATADLSLPLSHSGRWITDAQGRVVILHGLNMVYKRPPYFPAAVGFGEDDAAFLAAEGYNTVRVGLIYKAVEPLPGVYDEGYLDRIGETVDTLARHGIVSLLDFHQDLYNERFYGEGFPDWAVQDDGLPVGPNFGFDPNYLLQSALWRAYDHFWANDPGPEGVGLQDRYAAAWRHVARRFRDHPHVFGYDLFNEPYPGSQWPTCANPAGCPVFDAQMTAFVERAVDAIREVDPDTLIWHEPMFFFNNGAAENIGVIGDAHMGFSFHVYCLSAQDSGNLLCDTFDDRVFANAEARAQRTGEALLLTEWGALDHADNLQAMADRADRNMVGWQEWHYCPCDDPTTSAGAGSDKQAIVIDPAKPPAGDNLKAAKLGILSRPYPQAIAGTPTGFGYDYASKTFRLDFRTERADGAGAFGAGAETVIALPPRQYPDGYAVDVRGAEVVSAPGAALLRLRACAATVSVTVRPQGATRASCDAE